MAKAREAYGAALALMGRDPNGEGNTALKRRALALINILQGELYRISEGAEKGTGHELPPPVKDLEGRLGLDELLCRTVLPYGLAGRLLAEEDPVLAAGLLQRYRELKAEARASAAAESEDIFAWVNIDEWGEFGSWQ